MVIKPSLAIAKAWLEWFAYWMVTAYNVKTRAALIPEFY